LLLNQRKGGGFVMQTIENKSVAPIAGACEYQARRLYSLWDMISFLAGDLTRVIDSLDYWKRSIEEMSADAGGVGELQQLDRDNTHDALELLRKLCERLPLKASADRCLSLRRRLMGAVAVGENPACEYRVILTAMEDLLHCLKTECRAIQFAFISPEKVGFFEQHDLFGEPVSSAFPSAQSEIMEAGNCLAADLHTAAVFHLMRVAEWGLRALAKTLHVKLSVQIEFACWGQVIGAIKDRLDKLKGKTAAKDKKAQIYSALVLDIRAFSYLWRNPVMHVRSRYDEPQAQSAFNHVRSFMQRLTEMGIRERN
jgi:hypothetical protein